MTNEAPTPVDSAGLTSAAYDSLINHRLKKEKGFDNAVRPTMLRQIITITNVMFWN